MDPDLSAFQHVLSTALLRCADRRRALHVNEGVTGEDIKIVALLRSLATDVVRLDPHAYRDFALTFRHTAFARRFVTRSDGPLAQVGILYCPTGATDLVRWLTTQTAAPGGEAPRPLGLRFARRQRMAARPRSRTGEPSLPRRFATELSAGFAIVCPLLALWHGREAIVQWQDQRFVADHPAVTATVLSVEPSTAGRSEGSAGDAVLAFRPPGGATCRVTWHSSLIGLDKIPGDTVTVVPKSSSCEAPLVPSQLADPVQSLAIAAAMLVLGLLALRAWTWLFRQSHAPSLFRRLGRLGHPSHRPAST